VTSRGQVGALAHPPTGSDLWAGPVILNTAVSSELSGAVGSNSPHDGPPRAVPRPRRRHQGFMVCPSTHTVASYEPSAVDVLVQQADTMLGKPFARAARSRH
jgi:hypothetical protein